MRFTSAVYALSRESRPQRIHSSGNHSPIQEATKLGETSIVKSIPIPSFRYYIANLMACLFPYYTPVAPSPKYRSLVLDLQDWLTVYRNRTNYKQATGDFDKAMEVNPKCASA